MLDGLKKIIFWTYPRGSWQYDLAVLWFLAIIFLTPPSVFDGSAFQEKPSVEQEQQEPARAAPDLEEREGDAATSGRPEPKDP